MTVPDQPAKFDFEWLLKLRVAVARCAARWISPGGGTPANNWGPSGASVLKRGFPRTHHFAQARSVMAVATQRCDQLLAQTDAITLWRLPDVLEDRFESLWETWLDRHAEWLPYFEAVAAIRSVRCGPLGHRPTGAG